MDSNQQLKRSSNAMPTSAVMGEQHTESSDCGRQSHVGFCKRCSDIGNFQFIPGRSEASMRLGLCLSRSSLSLSLSFVLSAIHNKVVAHTLTQSSETAVCSRSPPTCCPSDRHSTALKTHNPTTNCVLTRLLSSITGFVVRQHRSRLASCHDHTCSVPQLKRYFHAVFCLCTR